MMPIFDDAKKIAELIRDYNNILVVAHTNPDGDAIGATGGMAWMLQSLDKTFALYNSSGSPNYLNWVPLPQKILTSLRELEFTPDLLIVLDCADIWRAGKEISELLPRVPSLSIDHHLGNPHFASLGNWVDPHMAATGQMIAAVADAAHVSLTDNLALCVYLSLLSDTGAFSHGNTTAAVFHLAARLLENGLDAASVRAQLENQWTLAKSKVWGKLFQNVELIENGQIAVCGITLAHIQSLGGKREDLEGFVEQMLHIKGVRVSLLIREDYSHHCKLSLRSQGQDDVRSVAAYFGGGGHLNAAGATVELSMHTLMQELPKHILFSLNK